MSDNNKQPDIVWMPETAAEHAINRMNEDYERRVVEVERAVVDSYSFYRYTIWVACAAVVLSIIALGLSLWLIFASA